MTTGKSYTTEDIITILFRDKKGRQETLRLFDTASEGRQYEIAKVLWEEFAKLKHKLALVKHEQFLKEVSDGKRKLTRNLMMDAYESVAEDFRNILSGKHESNEQVQKVRKRLQKIIAEESHKSAPNVDIKHSKNREGTSV